MVKIVGLFEGVDSVVQLHGKREMPVPSISTYIKSKPQMSFSYTKDVYIIFKEVQFRPI